MNEDSTTSRVLRLLSLLQTHRFWTGRDLAARLGTSGRTVRRDVERLRELGYRLSSTRGVDGGYQLEAGADLPPLVLTDEEAVALAVALRTAASNGPVVGLAETNVAVLAKLEQVLPTRLAGRVRALQSATAVPAPVGELSVADPETLARLAFACRDAQVLRLRYVAADGAESPRKVEPMALVPHARKWYLLCWDLTRQDWRTLRVDRIVDIAETRLPFVPRKLPAPDAATFVGRLLGESPTHTADVIIHASLDEASAYLRGYVRGLVSNGPHRTRWRIQAERMETLAGALAWLPWPFEVNGSPEFTKLLGEFRDRLAKAI